MNVQEKTVRKIREKALGVGPNERNRARLRHHTFEAVASKVESSTVRFELKTMSSFGVLTEPEVYELCSLEAVLKLYGGLEFPDPTTVAVPRSWRRMIIMQKEIPRMGLVCVMRVMG